LLLRSDAFWKFSLCEVYEESFGRIFTIYASKNEAVSCEVQTHFGGFHLARYTKKGSWRIITILRPKTKQFAVKFSRILEVFSVQAL